MKFFVFSSLLFFASCSPKYLNVYTMTKPVQSDDLICIDSIIEANFDVTRTGISFTMKNKTPDKIVIPWDDCSIIVDGISMRITHKGIRYLESDRTQPTTTIPGNTMIEEYASPAENTYFKEPSKYSYGGWTTNDLFPATNGIYNKGKKVSLFMPLKHKDKTIDYTFEFLIDDVIKK